MKTKLLWLTLIGLIALFFFPSIQSVLIKPEESTKPGGAPPARTAVYKLSLGHDHVTDSPHHQAALKFADLVAARSNGRVQVTVYPKQELGTGHQMVEQVREGSLAMALLPTARLSGIAPSMQYVDLPFLFPKREDAHELLDGEIGKMLFARLEPLGIIGCAFWDSGFKQLTANKPIRTPADFRGLKVRIMKSPIIKDQFESYRAQAIPIDFQQLHQALKDGVVDAEENPLIGIIGMKLYEVQSHLTLSNHAYLAYIFMSSKKVMDELPEDIRDLIVSTAREVALYERQLLNEKEDGYLKTIKNAGVEIHTLTEPESRAFYDATKQIRHKYRNQIGRDILDRTETLLTLKYGPGEDIVIGLDADLSLGAAVFGIGIKRGMELAAAEINETGGVLGRKLRIVSLDHAGVSARGIANIKRLATVPNLVAVVGGLHSPVTLAELPAIHENKMVYLGPYANAVEIVENGYQPNYVFRASPSTRDTSDFLVDKAVKQSQRVALLLENTAWGRSNYKHMLESLATHQLTPAVVEWMNFDEKNIGRQIASIVDSKAGVLLLAVNPGASITAVKDLAAHDVTLPVFSLMGVASPSFWHATWKELPKVDLYFNQSFSFSDQHGQALAKRYLQEYEMNRPADIPVPMAVSQAYDLVHMLALAIGRAHSLERPAIRDSLEKLGLYQGVIRKYDPPFTKKRHDALGKEDIILARFDGQGNVVPVPDRKVK